MMEVATSESAVSGHGMNQSMVQPLISPGKAWARDRNLGPTGEKQSERCRLERTRSIDDTARRREDNLSDRSPLPNGLL